MFTILILVLFSSFLIILTFLILEWLRKELRQKRVLVIVEKIVMVFQSSNSDPTHSCIMPVVPSDISSVRGPRCFIKPVFHLTVTLGWNNLHWIVGGKVFQIFFTTFTRFIMGVFSILRGCPWNVLLVFSHLLVLHWWFCIL